MLQQRIMCTFLLSGIFISSGYAGTLGDAEPLPYRGIYVEGNVGYAYHPWINDRTPTPGLENQLGVLRKLSNINGGAIGGADIGYQFARYLAVEGGWLYIPKASYNRYKTVNLTVAATTFTLQEGLQININSGLGYIAVKGMIPIFSPELNAFGKLGAAYTYNHTNVPIAASLVSSPTVYTSDSSNFWNPILAFGFQYTSLKNYMLNFQYGFVPGYRSASTNHFISPDIQTFTFGLGYKFST